MKRTSQTILLLLMTAALAMAGITTVDFASLPLPININGAATTVSTVHFLYLPDGQLNSPPPSNCIFNATTGTAFLDTTNFPGGCVGAQVDSVSGLFGTTDGSYELTFDAPVWNLHLVYGMLSLLTTPPVESDYSINAALFSGASLVAIASTVGSGGTLDTSPFYAGPFDAVYLSFTPTTPLNESLVPQDLYGLTMAGVSEVTFATPEPDALWLLLIGLAGIGANRVVRRRRA